MTSGLVCQLAQEIETDEEMQRLYNWVDDVPLSRQKRNIGRDFSDGVLMAEVVHHYFPSRVEMHNYQAANSVEKKEYNFKTLNQKVLRKLGFMIHDEDIHFVTRCAPGHVEKVLAMVCQFLEQRKREETSVKFQAEQHKQQQVQSPQHLPQQFYESEHGILQARNAPIPQQRNPAKQLPPRRSEDSAQDTANQISSTESAEQTVMEYKTTIRIMAEKIKKLEQLVQIKDSKIEALTNKLQQRGVE